MAAVDRGLLEAPRFLRPLDERLNPILVKEIRQALRGKLFRVGFLCAVALVTVVSLGVVMDMGTDISGSQGRQYFLSVFFCLCGAVLGLVPFSAFVSMGAEWDENTYDLLVISNLRPRQIVAGKLWSAATQAVLFYSAFTPFLCFAFLLRQVDVRVVAFGVVASFLLSLGLTLVALALSSITRQRFVRVILMAGLAAGLAGTIGMCMEIAQEFLRRPPFDEQGFWVAMAIMAVGYLLASALVFFTAANLLAHPEENRSTNIRILSTVTTLVGVGVCVFMSIWISRMRGGVTFDREAVSGMGFGLLALTVVPGIFFTTEREALGRRVVPRVPRNAGTALALAPWMPGGARGTWLVALQAAFVSLFVFVAQAYGEDRGQWFFADGIAAYCAALGYLVIYLFLPSGVFAGLTGHPGGRAAIRAAVPFLALVFAFGPSLLGFFFGDRSLMRGEHVGNPAYLFENLWEGRVLRGELLVLGGLVALTLLLNVPRSARALREVLAASRGRRAARVPAEVDAWPAS